MPSPTSGFHHVAITTADREVILSWYERVLGFRRGDDLGSDEKGFHATWLHKHDVRIEVFHQPNSQPLEAGALKLRDDNNLQGYVHICLQVDDMEASLAAVRAEGVTEIRGPFTDNDTHVQVAFFPDPDRNWIEFLQNI